MRSIKPHIRFHDRTARPLLNTNTAEQHWTALFVKDLVERRFIGASLVAHNGQPKPHLRPHSGRWQLLGLAHYDNLFNSYEALAKHCI